MSLIDLPDELLTRCCATRDFRWEDTKRLRLTCKRFALLFAQKLFSEVRLLPTPKSANKAQSILQDERLSLLVKTISIKPALKDVDDWSYGADENPCWKFDVPESENNESLIEDDCPSRMYGYELDHEDDESDSEDDGGDNGTSVATSLSDLEKELSVVYKRMLSRIGLFKNLRCIKLLHNMNVHEPSQDADDPEPCPSDAPESFAYRTIFFRQLLKALNHPDHPASHVHSLRILNLQDVVDVDIATSKNFKAVMSRLDSLELNIASWYERDSVRDISRDIELPEQHVFFGQDLQKYWLEPLQDQLVHLKLGNMARNNTWWGYLPKCDFRGLHFPRLRSLTLDYMTFTHDWQLDWILSHGDTLTSLTLDNCPIVHGFWIGHTLDSENYPNLRLGEHLKWETEGDDVNYWTYDGRWHEYFRKMKDGLPCLKHFKLTHCTNYDSKVDKDRYCIFFSGGWNGVGQIHLPKRHKDSDGLFPMLYMEDHLHPKPWLPHCDDDDQTALDALMIAIKSRT